MRNRMFLMVVLVAILVQQDLYAQGILYTAPGVDLSYGYGFDVGNGVQIGYGYGTGLLLTPQQLMTSSQGPNQGPLDIDGISKFQPDYGYYWMPPNAVHDKRSMMAPSRFAF